MDSNFFEFEVFSEIEADEPRKYNVLLLNDNYSTVDFVVKVLIDIFRKSKDEASKITFEVHKNGKAVCGNYTYEIAQTKVKQVSLQARKVGFPLKAIMEES